MNIQKKIGIIGLWHLGCVLSASWAKLGFKTKGFDPELDRVSSLQKGSAPIFEPNLNETIRDCMNKELLFFDNNPTVLHDCDFIFLTYDTPVNEQDESDTSILTQSIDLIKNILKNNAIVVVSSQSPVGFCSELRTQLKLANPTLELVYSPENLRLGEAIDCYLNPGRIILGANNETALNESRALFQAITNDILEMSLESSELVKHGINSFLAMSIVFANNLADICEMTGGNINQVVKGLKSDPRIGHLAYLAPGVGFSGGTLGRDLKVLEKTNNDHNGNANFFTSIHKSNTNRKDSIVNRILNLYNHDLANIKIGVLGLTYKPNTSTLRRSLPLEIVQLLHDNKANIFAFDPKADYSELLVKPPFTIMANIDELLSQKVDLVLVLTEWPEFKNINWEKYPNPLTIFDTKNIYSKDVLINSEIKLIKIGE